MHFDTIKKARLVLRKITPEVMKYVFTTYDNESQMNFLGLSNVEELVCEQKKYAEGLSTHNRKFEYFQMLTLDESRVVGWCGYHTWYIDHNRAELGYGLFDETIKRQGLMSEALDYILPHGFNSMNLNLVEALTGLSNVASLAVLKKYGFVKEGVLREHYRVGDILDDSILFGLLKSEWQKQKQTENS